MITVVIKIEDKLSHMVHFSNFAVVLIFQCVFKYADTIPEGPDSLCLQ